LLFCLEIEKKIENEYTAQTQIVILSPIGSYRNSRTKFGKLDTYCLLQQLNTRGFVSSIASFDFFRSVMGILH
jgi:hypothetical protein